MFLLLFLILFKIKCNNNRINYSFADISTLLNQQCTLQNNLDKKRRLLILKQKKERGKDGLSDEEILNCKDDSKLTEEQKEMKKNLKKQQDELSKKLINDYTYEELMNTPFHLIINEDVKKKKIYIENRNIIDPTHQELQNNPLLAHRYAIKKKQQYDCYSSKIRLVRSDEEILNSTRDKTPEEEKHFQELQEQSKKYLQMDLLSLSLQELLEIPEYLIIMADQKVLEKKFYAHSIPSDLNVYEIDELKKKFPSANEFELAKKEKILEKRIKHCCEDFRDGIIYNIKNEFMEFPELIEEFKLYMQKSFFNSLRNRDVLKTLDENISKIEIDNNIENHQIFIQAEKTFKEIFEKYKKNQKNQFLLKEIKLEIFINMFTNHLKQSKKEKNYKQIACYLIYLKKIYNLEFFELNDAEKNENNEWLNREIKKYLKLHEDLINQERFFQSRQNLINQEQEEFAKIEQEFNKQFNNELFLLQNLVNDAELGNNTIQNEEQQEFAKIQQEFLLNQQDLALKNLITQQEQEFQNLKKEFENTLQQSLLIHEHLEIQNSPLENSLINENSNIQNKKQQESQKVQIVNSHVINTNISHSSYSLNVNQNSINNVENEKKDLKIKKNINFKLIITCFIVLIPFLLVSYLPKILTFNRFAKFKPYENKIIKFLKVISIASFISGIFINIC